MALIKDSEARVFDTSLINKGDLIRAQEESWPEPQNGIVTAVSETQITVLFLPGVSNVTNYFQITAADVDDGRWTLRWTTDIVEVSEEGGTE